MILTHATLLADFPGTRFVVSRTGFDGTWRVKATLPDGLGTITAASATPLDAIRRIVRFLPERVVR